MAAVSVVVWLKWLDEVVALIRSWHSSCALARCAVEMREVRVLDAIMFVSLSHSSDASSTQDDSLDADSSCCQFSIGGQSEDSSCFSGALIFLIVFFFLITGAYTLRFLALESGNASFLGRHTKV